MNREPVVRFKHVAKRFELDRSTDRTLMDLVTRPFKHAKPKEFYWPLRDVSFELKRGGSLGIIGENGTGKSTILKLIARILVPTSGQVEAVGQVATLLELGASFHPELSGRENIFLAASIANISRQEIQRDLDEIISFADIGPYIDVPVKHYSSGMYVRLGFAVAVHLNPDVLLIDEVLAVGDENFQHKCIQRIKRLQSEEVAVILVSHGMQQIEDMCDDALWLHEGYVRSIGSPARVIADYLAESSAHELEESVAQWADEPTSEPVATQQRYERGAPSPEAKRWGDGSIQIVDLRLLGADGRSANVFRPRQAFRIEFDYAVQHSVEEHPSFGVAIYRSDQVWCYGTNTTIEGICFDQVALSAAGTVVIDIPDLRLLHGEYTLDVAVHDSRGEVAYDYIREAAHFYVQNPRGDQGVARLDTHWALVMNREQRLP